MLFQPTNIIPDERTGIGFGTVDVSAGWDISWQVNGDYPVMKGYSIQFYQNNAASTPVYREPTSGYLTTGCPFYGRNAQGEIEFFTHTMTSGHGITNGNEYKYVITQYYTENGVDQSVVQSSASVFRTRSAPSFSLATLTVGSAQFTFNINYSQAQGDTLDWIRWQIQTTSGSDTELIYDSGKIFGTPVYMLTYTGLFRGVDYAIRVTGQTSSGVEVDTEWQPFRPAYKNRTFSGTLTATCQTQLNAVKLDWTGAQMNPLEDGEYWPSGVDNNIWSIWRQKIGSPVREHVATVPVEVTTIYDFACPSGGDQYQYTLVAAVDETTDYPQTWAGNRVTSNVVTPNYYRWTLLDCLLDTDGTYRVQAEYDFRLNLDSGSVSNNNAPSVLQNFTPKPTIQPAPQNYRSGTLTSLVGSVSAQGQYTDTIDMTNALMALSTTQDALFLKSSKGDVLQVRIGGSVTVQTAENTAQLAQTITVPWVEVDDEPQSVIAMTSDNVVS